MTTKVEPLKADNSGLTGRKIIADAYSGISRHQRRRLQRPGRERWIGLPLQCRLRVALQTCCDELHEVINCKARM